MSEAEKIPACAVGDAPKGVESSAPSKGLGGGEPPKKRGRKKKETEEPSE